MEALRKQWRQLTLAEVAGALGDLGVFIPFLVGLAKHVGLDVGTTLIGTGVYNVLTGWHFGIPMPVQPMKNIGAVAIAEDLSLDEALAAGILTSAWVFLIGVIPMTLRSADGAEGRRSLVDAFAAVIPMPLVKGIQMGLGLSLARKGLTSMVLDSDGNLRSWFVADGLLCALLSVAFAVAYRDVLSTGPEAGNASHDPCACDEAYMAPTLTTPVWAGVQGDDDAATRSPSGSTSVSGAESDGLDAELGPEAKRLAGGSGETAAEEEPASDLRRQMPTALVLFGAGLILTFASSPHVISALRWGPSETRVHDLGVTDFRQGFLEGALPQIPLTTLNSIVAVSSLSFELFGEKGIRPSAIATSVSLMNLVGCWFGVMPACHGAGGLAAQHRFGARHGTAVLFLGVAKIILGLLFGSSLRATLDAFPDTILGAMLLVAGIELAISGFKQAEEMKRAVFGHGWFILLLTAIVALIWKTFIGFAAGSAAVLVLHLRWWVQQQRIAWRART